MKQKVIIRNGEDVVYSGKLQDLPLKHEYIIQRSIELFDDDDPCIIHQSYVVKDFADKLLDVLEKTTRLSMGDNYKLYANLKLGNIKELTIELLG